MAENDIIQDVTENIQQMAVHRNHEITVSMAKGEEVDCNPSIAKITVTPLKCQCSHTPTQVWWCHWVVRYISPAFPCH
jgi:hypothetical protein